MAGLQCRNLVARAVFLLEEQAHYTQADQSPDNVKSPDISLTVHGTPAHVSVTHIMPVLVLLSVVGVGMQQCMIQNQIEMHRFSKFKNERKYAGNNKQF